VTVLNAGTVMATNLRRMTVMVIFAMVMNDGCVRVLFGQRNKCNSKTKENE
jgi:hypothetical protein